MKQEHLPTDQAYFPSKYSLAFNHYSKTQIKLVMPFLTSIAQTCHYGSQFPVGKVLKAISKFFLLNEIEIIFLSYIIKETNWDIKDRIIASNAEHISDIVCYTIQNIDYKRIILYLMVSAFTVKYYLNKDTTLELQQATKRCPNFKNIFENWAKKHSSIATKINPRTLNKVYKQLFLNSRKQNKNFNMIVDSILQISPAYNPEKEKIKREEKKKSQPQPELQIKQQNLMLKHDKNGFISANPLALSNKLFPKIQNDRNNLQENLNPFLPSKNDVMPQVHLQMLGSSIIGFREDGMLNIGEDMSGNDEGRSYIQEDSLHSFGMIGLNRGISITEKYMSSEGKEKGSQVKEKDK